MAARAIGRAGQARRRRGERSSDRPRVRRRKVAPANRGGHQRLYRFPSSYRQSLQNKQCFHNQYMHTCLLRATDREWRLVRREYMVTELMFSRDRLPAFFGITQQFLQLYKASGHAQRYLARMWKSELILTLSRRVFEKSKEQLSPSEICQILRGLTLRSIGRQQCRKLLAALRMD